MTSAVADNDDSLQASSRQINVKPPIPYSFDLGNLLVIDSNPLEADPSEQDIQNAARDTAQALLNQLLTNCEVKNTSDGLQMRLPAPVTRLPREKHIPAKKPPTKWEQFAAKKGINKKRPVGNMIFDDEKGEWVPKWGHKGRNKEAENQWLVEVDAKKESNSGEAGNERMEKRRERKERIRRNERSQRANERRAKKVT